MGNTQENSPFLLMIHPDIYVSGRISSAPESVTTLEVTAEHKFFLTETVYKIGRNEQECQIVISSNRRDVRRIQAFIKREGSNYLLEDNQSPYGTFVNGSRIDSIWRLTKGEVIGFGATKEMLIFDDPKQMNIINGNSLTEKEIEALSYLAAGLTNKEIALKAMVSEEAIKKRLSEVYSKLEVKTRTEAVARARVLGLLSRNG